MAKPRSTHRRRLAPEQRRLELLEAGERVIRLKGTAARVEDVVAAANAAKGTFYVYFETWDAFLLALRDRAYQQLEDQFEAFQQTCSDWAQLIGGLPEIFIDLTLSLEGLHAAVFHAPVAEVAVTNPRFNVISRLSELIAQGVDENALQSPDVATTSRFVFALLHEAADLVAGGRDRDLAASTLQTLLLNALRVRRVRFRPAAQH